jgi:predicted transcriptional regulator
MARRPGLGQAESEVLRYIADKHPITVRDVAEHFAAEQGLTKTTLLNVMERLRTKGFLTRERTDERDVYRYSPARPKARLMGDVVRDFVDGMLGGSIEPFATYLAERTEVDADELARLKATIARLEEKQGGGTGATRTNVKEKEMPR